LPSRLWRGHAVLTSEYSFRCSLQKFIYTLNITLPPWCLFLDGSAETFVFELLQTKVFRTDFFQRGNKDIGHKNKDDGINE
jgi:hypothetical protein